MLCSGGRLQTGGVLWGRLLGALWGEMVITPLLSALATPLFRCESLFMNHLLSLQQKLTAPGRIRQVRDVRRTPTPNLQFHREPHRVPSAEKEYVLSDVLVCATALLDYGQCENECGSHKNARLWITPGRFLRDDSSAE